LLSNIDKFRIIKLLKIQSEIFLKCLRHETCLYPNADSNACFMSSCKI